MNHLNIWITLWLCLLPLCKYQQHLNSTLINVRTVSVFFSPLIQVWAQLSKDCDVIKNAELQQHSPGPEDGAAAEDRGQHREDKGAFIFIISSVLLLLHVRRGRSVCWLIPLQVSKASSDLMRYCGEHAKNDPLLMGIPASENPFKDKKPCTVL